MQISKIINNKPHAIELTYEEMEATYVAIQRSYFEEDFINHCINRLQKKLVDATFLMLHFQRKMSFLMLLMSITGKSMTAILTLTLLWMLWLNM